MCVAAAFKAKICPGFEPTNEETMVMDPSTKRRASRRRSSTASSSSSSAKRERTYVEHNYKDHYNDPIYVPGENEEEDIDAPKRRGPRGGVVVPFPERLYNMLKQAEHEGFEDIVSWSPHGRCFIVHQPKQFVEEVMPKFFRQSKLTSFQRQVNLYGFRRLTAGQDRGAYYHEMFLRGRPDLHKKLVRIRVKGTGFKSASSPATEPNFYTYQRCTEEGPQGLNAETEMPPIAAEPIPSSALSTPMPALETPMNPSWKPLSAPPKMVVVSPQLKPIESPTLDAQESKAGSCGQMTLSSMAKAIAFQTTSERAEEPCPVTPETNVRHIVSSGLEQALAMVSPVESPTPSPFPSMLSLADAGLAAKEAPMPLPELVDNRMDTFQEGIQALLNSDLNDFDVDHNMLIDNTELPNDYSLDPLFMLDDVVSATL